MCSQVTGKLLQSTWLSVALQNRMIHVWTKVCDFIVLSKSFPFTLQTLLSEHGEKNWSSSREDILLLSHSVRDIIYFVLSIKFSGICIAKVRSCDCLLSFLVNVCSYTFIPTTRMGEIWEVVASLLAFLTAVTVALQASFLHEQPVLWTVNYLMDIFFAVDM